MMGIKLDEMRRKKALAGSKGFTLIELMIVVAIIGILASILALNYAHAKQDATVSATEANVKEIATALEMYEADNQNYPVSGPVNATLIGPKYLPSTPASPGLGAGVAPANEYVYTLAPSGIDYTVTDPATYDSDSLANLPWSQGFAPGAGVPPAPAGKCNIGGTCLHVGYSNDFGVFAY